MHHPHPRKSLLPPPLLFLQTRDTDGERRGSTSYALRPVTGAAAAQAGTALVKAGREEVDASRLVTVFGTFWSLDQRRHMSGRIRPVASVGGHKS